MAKDADLYFLRLKWSCSWTTYLFITGLQKHLIKYLHLQSMQHAYFDQ